MNLLIANRSLRSQDPNTVQYHIEFKNHLLPITRRSHLFKSKVSFETTAVISRWRSGPDDDLNDFGSQRGNSVTADETVSAKYKCSCLLTH